jgi:hypothetical protein
MTREALATRLLSGLDLVIDLVTLGEYGLEPLPAGHHEGRERSGHGHGDGSGREEKTDRTIGWEALAPARRGGCARHGSGHTAPRHLSGV